MKRVKTFTHILRSSLLFSIVLTGCLPASADELEKKELIPSPMDVSQKKHDFHFAGPRVTGPAKMIRLGDAHFDPLYRMPIQKSGLPAVHTSYENRTGYYIVQFDGPVKAEWKDALLKEDVKIYDYLPDFAFMVFMPASKAETVRELNNVRWVGVFQPSYRISTSAMNMMYSESGKSETIMASLRVNIFPGTEFDYSIENVPAGTYYLYACAYIVSQPGSIQKDDYLGFYGTGMDPPEYANVVVPSSGSVTFDITLNIMDSSRSDDNIILGSDSGDGGGGGCYISTAFFD